MKLRDLLSTASADLTVAVGSIQSEGNKLIVEFTGDKSREPYSIPVDPEKFYKLMAEQYTGKARVAYRNPKDKTVVTEADYVDRRDEKPATTKEAARVEKCQKHKKNQGLRKPRNGCPGCEAYYEFVRSTQS